MSRSTAREKRQAAALLLVEAGKLARLARAADTDSERLRLRGRALIMRGSAWLLDAERTR